MEIKKSPKADLEGKKTTWLLAGYVLVMAVLFLGFEWTQRDVKIDTSNNSYYRTARAGASSTSRGSVNRRNIDHR